MFHFCNIWNPIFETSRSAGCETSKQPRFGLGEEYEGKKIQMEEYPVEGTIKDRNGDKSGTIKPHAAFFERKKLPLADY
jgi:hypothetical protein